MKRSEVLFLSVDHVLRMHEEAVVMFGGSAGTLVAGMLESAVIAPRNAYLGSLAELAAAYAYGIAMNHSFVDGNKRTAAYAMLVFLELNGIELTLPIETWEPLIEDVAAGNVTQAQLAEEIANEIGRRRGVAGPAMWVDLESDDEP